jgi:glycosyltransferase involved in cell wall biosynthesis
LAETILHLLDCLNPGGTERQLIEQCRALDRRRWRPIVGCFHPRGALTSELHAMAIPVTDFPLHTRFLHPNTALQVARIGALCRREKVRLIHAHDFYGDLVGHLASAITKVPLVASRRDLMHFLDRRRRWLLGQVCRRADRVVANARAVAANAADEWQIPVEKLRVVPNGIDLARFDEEMRKAPDPPLPESNLPTVAVVANLHLPAKGQADLLEAAELLAQRGRRIRVLVVGDGIEREKLEKLAQRLSLDAHFLGNRRDVPRILSRIDIACSPSWAESYPNALVEAMAASRPVVATSVGGCPELVAEGESGLLVPPRDPHALAEALESILADPKRAEKMGRQGRLIVEERHDLSKSARLLDGIYRELVPAD